MNIISLSLVAVVGLSSCALVLLCSCAAPKLKPEELAAKNCISIARSGNMNSGKLSVVYPDGHWYWYSCRGTYPVRRPTLPDSC